MGQTCSGANCTRNVSASTLVVLTSDNIDLIRESWKLVVKGGFKEYGTKMMIKIFLEHKELKPLWKFARSLETYEQMNSSNLIKQHGEKLFTTIDAAINMLADDFQTLTSILHRLGSSHYKFGARPQHFQIVGAALIDTLQDNLKNDFDDKTKKAWLTFFSLVEMEMRVGMQNVIDEEKILND